MLRACAMSVISDMPVIMVRHDLLDKCTRSQMNVPVSILYKSIDLCRMLAGVKFWIIIGCPNILVNKVAKLCMTTATVEFQWLEHLSEHENLF